jgi:hypothetical protein
VHSSHGEPVVGILPFLLAGLLFGDAQNLHFLVQEKNTNNLWKYRNMLANFCVSSLLTNTLLHGTPLANIAGLEHLTKTYEICDKKHIKLSKDSILI